MFMRMRFIDRVIMFVIVCVITGAGNRRGGGENEPPRLDPLGSDQIVGELANRPRSSPQQNHLQASTLIKVNMRSGDDAIEVRVLQIGEASRRSSRVVIVDEGEDAERLLRFVGDDFFDERPAHQASDGLGAVGIPMPIAVAIESLKQIAADRHAESYERVFHIERPVIFQDIY